MKLAELLAKLPIDYLVRIAMNCSIVCGTHSKRQLIRAIHDNFRRPQFVEHVLSSWSEQERATLAYLLLAPGAGEGQPFLPEDPEVLAERAHDRQIKQYSDTIRSHGFLLPFDGRESEESAWVIPDDLQEILRDLLLDYPEHPPSRPEGHPEKVLRAPGLFLEDFFSLLVFASKDDLRLTRDGSLFKRSWEGLSERFLQTEEETLQKRPAGFPDRVALMVGFATRYQLLVEKDQKLASTRNLDPWMKKEDLDKYADIYGYLQNVVIPREAACTRILRFLESQPEDVEWTSITEPVGACYGRFPGKPWWLDELKARVYWLFHVLMNLGFLDLALFGQDGEVAYRWTPLGNYFVRGRGHPPDLSRSFELHVQPDFEIFVPGESDLRKRWVLEGFADLISRDVVVRYRMSRESVYRGLKAGVTAERITGFLEEHSQKAVPQNVLFSLENWTSQYGNISFADVLLMRCDSEQVAQEIKLSPELAPLIKGSITARDLIISRKDRERVLRILERHGYLPKPGIIRFDEE